MSAKTTNRMYVMTPRDHMSHEVSYFSGPNTSGARKKTQKQRILEKVKTLAIKNAHDYTETFSNQHV